MKIEKLNQWFQFTQLLQLALMAAQGVLIIVMKDAALYAPVWVGLTLLALLQVGLVFYYPEKVKTSQITDRKAMVNLRLLALLPYVLIMFGLLLSK